MSPAESRCTRTSSPTLSITKKFKRNYPLPRSLLVLLPLCINKGLFSGGGSFALPGVYFKYEINPLMIKINDKNSSFANFLTRVSSLLPPPSYSSPLSSSLSTHLLNLSLPLSPSSTLPLSHPLCFSDTTRYVLLLEDCMWCLVLFTLSLLKQSQPQKDVL